jgi:hypothetical protein
MAIVTPGTGATITASTIEGQLFQLVHFINNAEAVSAIYNTFSLSKGEDGTMESAFSLTGTFSIALDGSSFLELPSPYLTTVPFTPGTTIGTIKGDILSEYFINACKYALVLQRNAAKNPQKITGIELTFDFTSATYAGKISLPYASSIGVNGSISEIATEWLLA